MFNKKAFMTTETNNFLNALKFQRSLSKRMIFSFLFQMNSLLYFTGCFQCDICNKFLFPFPHIDHLIQWLVYDPASYEEETEIYESLGQFHLQDHLLFMIPCLYFL